MLPGFLWFCPKSRRVSAASACASICSRRVLISSRLLEHAACAAHSPLRHHQRHHHLCRHDQKTGCSGRSGLNLPAPILALLRQR